jgi:hypothetical protein
MTDATTTDTAAETATDAGEQKPEQAETFTKAQVDAIVNQRLKQQAQNKFGDYEDLKTKAAGAQTLEERLAAVEGELSSTKAEALRTSIAAQFGISTKKGDKGEPSDADLFLTGTDESILTAQAQRLAGRQADAKKNGNVAPKEGETTRTGDENSDAREFVGNLFGGSD